MKRILVLIFSLCTYASANAQDITVVEYFVDTDPGFGSGTNVAITPAASIENFSFTIDITSFSDGFHSLFLRAKDANGNWSAAYSRPFYKLSASAVTAAPNIDKAEYFIDDDPGFGAGTDVPIASTQSIADHSFTIALNAVTDGFHTLSLRARDATGNWSAAYSRPFYKLSASAVTAAPNIDKVEYFIDGDPGYGAGTDVPIASAQSIADNSFTIALSAVPDGFHTLSLRARDAAGNWGGTYSRPFYKLNTSGIPAANIDKLEYFFDVDPGYGAATNVIITHAIIIDDFNFSVDVSALSEGPHKLFVRAKDVNNNWSIVEIADFTVCDAPASTTFPATDVTTTSFIANWSGATDAIGYRLDVSSDNFLTFVFGYNDKPVAETFSAVTGLASGTAYKYRIRSVGSTCTSVNSATEDVTTLFLAPSATPATGISQTGFTAHWDIGDGASGYRLDLSTDDFNTTIAGFDDRLVESNTETITDLEPGTEYQYRIRAENNGVASDNSNTVQVITIPANPTSTEASDLTQNSFTASWNAVGGAISFYLDVSADNFTTYITGFENTKVVETTAIISGLVANTLYQYRVRAANTSGSSFNSNTVDVTTLSKTAQTITFEPPDDQVMGNAPFSLIASSTSNLSILFTTTSSKITIADDLATLQEAGLVTITANQEGNEKFVAATPVDQTFCINPPKPTITIIEDVTEMPELISNALSGNQWFLNGAAMTGENSESLIVFAPGIYTVLVEIEGCKSEVSTDFSVIVTALENNKKTNDLNLYPNPVSEILEITIPQSKASKHLNILDTNGKTLHSIITEKSNIEVNTSGFPPGLYQLIIFENIIVYRKRFIKN